VHFDTAGLRSKSWDEFAQADAVRMDFVITVCDSAAGEVCPVWPGQPVSAHWSFPDPAAHEGSETERRAFFREVFRQIRNRIDLFLALPLTHLDRLAITREMGAIGRHHG
jgi:arsenate reductase